MKITARKLFLIYLILFNLQNNYAQPSGNTDPDFLKWKSYFNQLYGADYNLMNGIRYINIYPSAEGHPFLGEDRFYQGNVVINNQLFRDVEIKYDICNQEIILQYQHFSGGTDKIILVKEFIDEFVMDGKLFRKYNFPETVPGFYQVVSQSNIYCLYYWEKDLLKGSSVQSFYKYSPERKLSYLVIDNKLRSFKGRRSFVKLFPPEYHKDIMQFLKSNKIWIRDADEIKIRQLMAHCNKLIQGN
jgi:hypothetical protein